MRFLRENAFLYCLWLLQRQLQQPRPQMNDPAASGQGIRQRLSFESRGQRDAGPSDKVRWVFEELMVSL